MRWSKIKNIIILLLVVMNVCLLAMVGLRAGRTARGARETRERMVAVLEQNGITYLPEEMPGEMDLTPLRVSLTTPGPEKMAALLGPLSQEQGGVYVGEGGSALASADGTLEVEFEPERYPLDGADPGTAGLEVLETLGIQGVERGRETAGDTVTVTFIQLWAGAPVPDMPVRLTYTSGALTRLSGRLLTGTAETVAGDAPINAPTALSRFLAGLGQEGYVCSQISALYPGYAASGTESVSLTPTWYLETDAWPWRFGVNALTGAVTAAE